MSCHLSPKRRLNIRTKPHPLHLPPKTHTNTAGARAQLYAACDPGAWAASAATGGFFDANARPAVLSPAQLDDGAAAWLWEWSAREVALPREWDLAPAEQRQSGAAKGGSSGKRGRL